MIQSNDFLLAILLCLSCTSALAETLQIGLYNIGTKTIMPHLEENLHYATTQEQRCVQDLPDLFAILEHNSFTGCSLENPQQQGDTLELTLRCENEQATGQANLLFTPKRISGELAIKMGGKNMTFTQRIEARWLGGCDIAND